MPRVSIKKKEYKARDFCKWLYGELKERKIRQREVAEWLGITQPAVSQKIDKCDFNFMELLIIFEKLGTDQEQIGKLLKV